jgi:hypothetical protein
MRSLSGGPGRRGRGWLAADSSVPDKKYMPDYQLLTRRRALRVLAGKASAK